MHQLGKTCRRYPSFLVQISGIVPRLEKDVRCIAVPENETLGDYLQIAARRNVVGGALTRGCPAVRLEVSFLMEVTLWQFK